jgi:hypothetical protein
MMPPTLSRGRSRAAMWRSTSMYASSPTSKITFTIRPPVNSKAGVYSLLTASPPS